MLCWAQSLSHVPLFVTPMDCSPPGSSVHEDSPGKNTAVGGHALLQRIFPTQGSNPGLPHCRQILYQLSPQGSPRILEWVAMPPPGDLPNPGVKPTLPASPALAGGPFILGYAGSSWLHKGFLQLWQVKPALRCGAQASHCSIFCHLRAWTLGLMGYRSHGMRAQLPRDKWNLPRPGMEPVYLH